MVRLCAISTPSSSTSSPPTLRIYPGTSGCVYPHKSRTGKTPSPFWVIRFLTAETARDSLSTDAFGTSFLPPASFLSMPFWLWKSATVKPLMYCLYSAADLGQQRYGKTGGERRGRYSYLGRNDLHVRPEGQALRIRPVLDRVRDTSRWIEATGYNHVLPLSLIFPTLSIRCTSYVTGHVSSRKRVGWLENRRRRH